MKPLPLPSPFADEEIRFLVVGETHGTDTAPELFGDMVCAAVLQGQVTIHLELPAELDGAFNTYIATGDGAAFAEIRDNWVFTGATYDGRGSRAFLDLIERLRAMARAGMDIAVNASQPAQKSLQPQHYYELAMAEDWANAAALRPDALNLILVGTYHARKLHKGFPTTSAVSFLMDSDFLALAPCAEGGTAYVFTINNAGEAGETITNLNTDDEHRARGIYPVEDFAENQTRYGPAAFDGFYCAGRPAIASERAVAAKLQD